MGFIKKIPFISKINRHIICFFDRTLLFYQWMLFIVHAGEMKECQHITTDVFAFFHTMPIFTRMGGSRGIPVIPEPENLSVMLV